MISASVLQFALFMLALHPEIQDRLYETEIKGVNLESYESIFKETDYLNAIFKGKTIALK